MDAASARLYGREPLREASGSSGSNGRFEPGLPAARGPGLPAISYHDGDRRTRQVEPAQALFWSGL
jgi:hypothetical protein